MADPINTAQSDDSGQYADEGTAAHTLAALLLNSKTGMKAEDWIGKVIGGGKREFEITEEFAFHVQTYVDDVQRRAMGGYLLVEQRVTLAGIEGFDTSHYGTSDAIIAIPARDKEPAYGVVEDLKFGRGESVYAWTSATPESLFTMDVNDGEEISTIEPNFQLMMYGLACLNDIRMLIDEPKFIRLVINQPRLGIVSELDVPIGVLERFGVFAYDAYLKAELALGMGVRDCESHDAISTTKQKFFNPGEKQCRWCRRVVCKARDAKVQELAGADFEVISTDNEQLAQSLSQVAFIEDWCRAVREKAQALVMAGEKLIGPDGQPYKIVEGKQGNRKWADETKAEAALVGQLGEKAYQPKKILTASAAAKVLDKKATKNMWKDFFVPLIKRAPGKPLLVPGSDPRPPYETVSGADEFDTEEEHDE